MADLDRAPTTAVALTSIGPGTSGTVNSWEIAPNWGSCFTAISFAWPAASTRTSMSPTGAERFTITSTARQTAPAWRT